MKKNIIIGVLILLVLVGAYGWKSYFRILDSTENITYQYITRNSNQMNKLVNSIDEREQFEINLDRLIRNLSASESVLRISNDDRYFSKDRSSDLSSMWNFYSILLDELIEMRYAVNRGEASYNDYLEDMKVLNSLLSDFESINSYGEVWEHFLSGWKSKVVEYMNDYPDNRFFNERMDDYVK